MFGFEITIECDTCRGEGLINPDLDYTTGRESKCPECGGRGAFIHVDTLLENIQHAWTEYETATKIREIN